VLVAESELITKLVPTVIVPVDSEPIAVELLGPQRDKIYSQDPAATAHADVVLTVAVPDTNVATPAIRFDPPSGYHLLVLLS